MEHKQEVFIFYSDLIEGLIKVIDLDKLSKPVDLGNTNEFRIIDLAEMILKKIKTKSKITFTSLPSDDPKQRKPDISLAKKQLSWSPKIQIDEGLDMTIEYFKKLI